MAKRFARVALGAMLVLLFAATQSPATAAQPHGWQTVALPTGNGSLWYADDVGFLDPQHGWVFGYVTPNRGGYVQGTLWITANGGRSWLRQSRPSAPYVSYVAGTFGDVRHGWLALRDHGAVRILGTTDGGRHWIQQASMTGDALGMTAVDRTHAWIYGNGGFLAATSNGRTWTRLTAPRGVDFATGLQFLTARRGWLTGSNGWVYTTTDGGHTWTALTRPGYLLTAHFVDPATGWAATTTGLYGTADGGRNWHRVSTAPTLLSIDFSGKRGWAVGAGAVAVHTTDGGRTWQRDDADTYILEKVSTTGCGDAWAVGTAVVHHGCH
jgi:photosystem II stability/assembly factor-like uncharacterized protein